jgi:hypothetical protein
MEHTTATSKTRSAKAKASSFGIQATCISVTTKIEQQSLSREQTIGDWSDNEIEGKGFFYFAYGGLIKGEFLRGKPHGNACLLFQSGDYYKGSWKEGSFHGKGVRYYSKQDTWCLNLYNNGDVLSTVCEGKGIPRVEGNFLWCCVLNLQLKILNRLIMIS